MPFLTKYRIYNTWVIFFSPILLMNFLLWLSFSARRERPIITVGGGDLFLPQETASHFFFFKLSSTSNFNSFTPEEKILVVIERFPAINLYCIFNSQYCTFLLEMRVRLTHTLDWLTRLPWRVNPHILGRRGRKEFDDDTTQWLGKIATGFLVEAWQYFIFTYPEATNLTISINAFLVDKKGRQFAIWK